MSPKRLLRRTVLVGAATFLVAFEPVPVRLEIENDTQGLVRVRIDADAPWMDVPAGKTATLTTFPHAGLCRPPQRWLPEYFTGLDLQRANGEQTRIDRATFEQTAVWGTRENWTLTLQ